MAFNIFQRGRYSLFGEILDWMLIPLILVCPMSLVLTWLVAQNLAGKPFDRALQYNVRAIEQLVKIERQKTVLNLPAPAREILRANEVDTVYYQVFGIQGEFVAGERQLPLPLADSDRTIGKIFLRSDEFQGRDIRVAYLWTYLPHLYDYPPGEKPVLIQVAETVGERSTLAGEIIKGVMLPQLLILPLMIFLIWLALLRGMRPINQLEKRIRQRQSDDVSPLDLSDAPREVTPLMTSINDLLERLGVLINSQKRFLANAAHQLKTPLAGLRMQADLAQRDGASAEELKHSLRQIGRSSIRATHTVNQLLALARAETTGNEIIKTKVRLIDLIMSSLQESYSLAKEKNIDLGFDDSKPVHDSTMLGNAVLLKELIRNLIENAIHYTPSGGIVTTRLLQNSANDEIVLQVEDTGPGIALEQRERVMQPFYRINDSLNNQVDGSGLGLAIVQAIARQHHGQVFVEDAKQQMQSPGTLITVRFAHVPTEAKN